MSCRHDSNWQLNFPPHDEPKLLPMVFIALMWCALWLESSSSYKLMFVPFCLHHRKNFDDFTATKKHCLKFSWDKKSVFYVSFGVEKFEIWKCEMLFVGFVSEFCVFFIIFNLHSPHDLRCCLLARLSPIVANEGVWNLHSNNVHTILDSKYDLLCAIRRWWNGERVKKLEMFSSSYVFPTSTSVSIFIRAALLLIEKWNAERQQTENDFKKCLPLMLLANA